MTSAGPTTPSAAKTITEHEAQEVDRANATGRTTGGVRPRPVALAERWDRWAALSQENGFVPLTPGWPNDPETVEEARAHPEVFAHKSVGQVATHSRESSGDWPGRPR